MHVALASLLAVLSSAPDAGVLPRGPESAFEAGLGRAQPAPLDDPTFYGGVELEALALSSGAPEGELDGFGVVTPLLGAQVGDGFVLELGVPLRVRLLDAPPAQRGSDAFGLLRGADWDARADLGQLLRVLRLGSDASFARLRAGALHGATLGLGHLVSRYSNQDDPDARPAGAQAGVELGPARLELLASDVLSARLFAAELAWDLGRTLSSNPEHADRWALAASVAADLAGGPPPFGCSAGCLAAQVDQRVALVHLDASWVAVRARAVRLMLEAGGGLRLSAPFEGGVVGGVVADTELGPVALSGRVELRTQRGGFRQGLFGPLYEVARFSGVGFHERPLALEVLPAGASFAAEVRAASGTAFTAVAAVEAFQLGRTDVDVSATVELLAARLSASARFVAQGLGQAPRLYAAGSLRLRLATSLYVVGSGGTVFFPQPDGSLVRGVTASLGVGLDFAR